MQEQAKLQVTVSRKRLSFSDVKLLREGKGIVGRSAYFDAIMLAQRKEGVLVAVALAGNNAKYRYACEGDFFAAMQVDDHPTLVSEMEVNGIAARGGRMLFGTGGFSAFYTSTALGQGPNNEAELLFNSLLANVKDSAIAFSEKNGFEEIARMLRNLKLAT